MPYMWLAISPIEFSPVAFSQLWPPYILLTQKLQSNYIHVLIYDHIRNTTFT